MNVILQAQSVEEAYRAELGAIYNNKTEVLSGSYQVDLHRNTDFNWNDKEGLTIEV
jgi:hypothetical protein|tara:strand:- start:5281 stop:5448 length:168 start_codon:yes stop_codon:yes gene_type:complete